MNLIKCLLSFTLITFFHLISNGQTPYRVVRMSNPQATDWNFVSSADNYYWKHVNQTVVNTMVEDGVKRLTGLSSGPLAWRKILSTYKAGQIVGIKVNGNDLWNSDQSEIDVIPEVVNAVIRGIKSANFGTSTAPIMIPETSIRVIEGSLRNRYFYNYHIQGIQKLYPNVKLQDNDDTRFGNGGSAQVVFGGNIPSQNITELIAGIDHLILMPIMKAIHPNWGVTGSVKLMMGVIPNPLGLHNYIARTTADNPVVLIYKNPHILGKTRLIVGDGLFGTWTGIHFNPNDKGEVISDVPRRWLTFQNDAPNSLFFSFNPVAMDSVLASYIDSERAARTMKPLNHPQLAAAQAGGLGVFERKPFSKIEYLEGATTTSETDLKKPQPPTGLRIVQ